ncbi:MAG: NAD(P)H-hydrate epimerase, partial [Gammaproteobacteria bacterium]|nr:NAD(P)H-hydrate epimerase [Gammaproteobacteria bacterium]
MNQFIEVLPSRLYSAEQSRLLDQIAIEEFNIPGYTLMKNAGTAAFNLLQNKFPLAKRIMVCCGAGNNAGDGYVLARLAHKAGYKVSLVSMVEPGALKGDAEKAFQDWKSLGQHAVEFKPALLEKTDVIIDALLGTGLQRPVAGEWKELIAQINASSVPVISVDIPSGLSADTGSVLGAAIKADLSISFISLKKGMFTHQAVDHCGEIYFNDLAVPEGVYDDVAATTNLLVWSELKHKLGSRRRSSHKGTHGHVLVVGGNYGMAGAARLAAESALRAGAGLVTVVTRPEHVAALISGRPELMVLGSERGDLPGALLNRVSGIIIGPGLGSDSWARHLLSQVLESKLPKVIDADALNLLSSQDDPDASWILTPHPGEASRLLDEDVPAIQD